MPGTDRIPDGVLLAAVQRAQLHQDHEEGVAIFKVKAHLGLPHNGGTTRQLRPRLDALVSARLLSTSHVRSRQVWTITTAGRRRAVEFSELPEAPQHQQWRETRARAAERTPEFRRELVTALADARRLLRDGGDSDAWADLARRLRLGAWRLASVAYCLNEWPEPDDAAADMPGLELRARRNPIMWGI